MLCVDIRGAIMKMIRTYTELKTFQTFEERFKYLQLNGSVGEETFGFDRYINQRFYRSSEWKNIRNYVICRDNGCDLAVDGYEIVGRVYIHHINPITIDDFRLNSDFLLNPEYLISVTHDTHNAIHYGDEKLLINIPVERSKNDTIPWKIGG